MRTRIALLLALCFVAVASFGEDLQSPFTKKRPLGVPSDAAFFNGKWYKVYLEREVKWNVARDKCGYLGGQLCVIHDQPTQDFVRGLAKGLELWLGATDEKVEGLWKWVDGTEMKYKAWSKYQPDNAAGAENYLEIARNGAWNDLSLKSKAVVGYICEWKDK